MATTKTQTATAARSAYHATLARPSTPLYYLSLDGYWTTKANDPSLALFGSIESAESAGQETGWTGEFGAVKASWSN